MNDPFLTFNQDESEDDDNNFGQYAGAHYISPNPSVRSDFSSDDFSDILSVSQVGKIYDDNVLDLDYVPSSLTDHESHLSDYFSGEGDVSGDSSLDSLILQCLFDNITFDNAEEFKAHQITSHTVNGRFSCGLCEKTIQQNT